MKTSLQNSAPLVHCCGTLFSTICTPFFLMCIPGDDPAQRHGKGLAGGKSEFSGRRDLRPKRLFFAFDPDFTGYRNGPLSEPDKALCRTLREASDEHRLYEEFLRGRATMDDLHPRGWDCNVVKTRLFNSTSLVSCSCTTQSSQAAIALWMQSTNCIRWRLASFHGSFPDYSFSSPNSQIVSFPLNYLKFSSPS